MRPFARASSHLSNRQSSGTIEEELLDQDTLPNSTSTTDKRLSNRHIRCIHIVHRASYALPLTGGILDPTISSAHGRQHMNDKEKSLKSNTYVRRRRRTLKIWLDGSILFIKLCKVWHKVFHHISVR